MYCASSGVRHVASQRKIRLPYISFRLPSPFYWLRLRRISGEAKRKEEKKKKKKKTCGSVTFAIRRPTEMSIGNFITVIS